MSADNYYFVSKTDDGKFAVSHRFASTYYKDQVGDEVPAEAYAFEGDKDGWKARGDSKLGDKKFATYEEMEANLTRRPDWIEEPPKTTAIFDTLEEALLAAHRYVAKDEVVEYGVIVQEGLLGNDHN